MARKRHVAVDPVIEPESEPEPPQSPVYIKMRFAIHLLASTCMGAAFWGFITDPYEVTHNIEALHSLLHHKSLHLSNSTSFAYLSLYLPILHLFGLMGGPKASSYFIIRLISCTFTAISLILFYRNVQKKFGGFFSAILLILMTFSPVLFISSAELLVESFAMSCVFLFMALWLGDDLFKGLLVVAVASVIAWPFAILLAFPVVISKLMSPQRQKMVTDLVNLLKITIFVVVIPAILIDYYFYEDLVLSALNYILEIDVGNKNYFFHVINGFVNFGLCFPISLFSLPILVLHSKYCPDKAGSYNREYLVSSLTALLGFVGLCGFLPVAETRYIFPLFPFFAFSAAFSLVLLQDILNKMEFNANLGGNLMINLNLIVLVVHFCLGALVIVGLYLARSGPINGFMSLNGMPHLPALAEETNVHFCMEDLRFFQSNFLFPRNNWTLHVLRDEGLDSSKNCHFIGGLDSGRVAEALKSENWNVFFNTSMSLMNESARWWWNYFTPYWAGYAQNFYILEAKDLSLVEFT